MTSPPDDTRPPPAAPRFSVIIATYNRAALVQATLASVLGQSLADREIIVVDDGSTDDTAAIISRRFGDQVRVISMANRGLEGAYNEGLRHARGEFSALLDSDDLFYPHTLAVYDRLLRATPDTNLLLGRGLDFADGTAPIAADPPTTLTFARYDTLLDRDRGGFTSCSLIVVRTAIVRTSGGFRAHNPFRLGHEDFYFLLRHGTVPGAIVLHDPPTVAYRRHAGNSVRNIGRLLDSIEELIAAEKRGEFPGGPAQRPARCDILAGTVLFWVRHGLFGGHALASLGLLARHPTLIARGLLAKIRRRLRRRPLRTLSA